MASGYSQRSTRFEHNLNQNVVKPTLFSPSHVETLYPRSSRVSIDCFFH